MAALRNTVSAARRLPSMASRISARPAVPAARLGAVASSFMGRRGYAAPARDAMTGEIIQLPDIDVSCRESFAPS